MYKTRSVSHANPDVREISDKHDVKDNSNTKVFSGAEDEPITIGASKGQLD